MKEMSPRKNKNSFKSFQKKISCTQEIFLEFIAIMDKLQECLSLKLESQGSLNSMFC